MNDKTYISFNIDKDMLIGNYDECFIDILKSRYFHKVNFDKTTLLFVTDNGELLFVESDEHDNRHVDAYNRLIRKYENSFTNHISTFINDSNKILTGFDISKFIAANNSAVAIFHTDVSNYYRSIKKSSIILPKVLTEIQAQKLFVYVNSCKDYELHVGISYKKAKKNKIFYTPMYDIENDNVRRK